MGFPYPGRSQEDHIVVGFDKRQFCQFPDEPLIERGLKREIELFQCFACGQFGRLEAFLPGSELAGCYLHREHTSQEGIIGETVHPGLLIEIWQSVLYISETQGLEQLVHGATSTAKS